MDELLTDCSGHNWIAYPTETEEVIGDIAWFVVEMEVDANEK